MAAAASPARPSAALLALADACAGAAGGVLSCGTLYPLEMLKSLMATDARGAHAIIADRGGVAGLYKGVEYKALNVAVAKFVYFYVYATLKKGYEGACKRGFTPAHNLLAGYVSDLLMVPAAMPLEYLVAKVQRSGRDGAPPQSAFAIAKETYASSGIAGFYPGSSWQFVISWMAAIQQTIFDQIKAMLLRSRAALSARDAFLLGAVSRLIALVLIFPFVRIKTVVQAGGKVGEVTQAFRKDPTSLYQGFAPEALRGILSSALLFMVKERLYTAVVRVIAGRAA